MFYVLRTIKDEINNSYEGKSNILNIQILVTCKLKKKMQEKVTTCTSYRIMALDQVIITLHDIELYLLS